MGLCKSSHGDGEDRNQRPTWDIPVTLAQPAQIDEDELGGSTLRCSTAHKPGPVHLKRDGGRTRTIYKWISGVCPGVDRIFQREGDQKNRC